MSRGTHASHTPLHLLRLTSHLRLPLPSHQPPRLLSVAPPVALYTSLLRVSSFSSWCHASLRCPSTRADSASPLYTSTRTSQVTSFKQEGYYRLPLPKQITIDPCVYEIHTVRGSGPGGQGTNSSSNKVELRVDVALLGDSFDDDVMKNLLRRETGKAITADGSTLIVSSHAHRSALQNKEDCLRQVRELLHKASWVPPVESDPVQTPTALISRQKAVRRRKGDALRMRRSARQGQW